MPRKPGGEAVIRARLDAAPGVSRAQGHRLAGLLEAECHLGIAPNNTDDWRCFCAVALRDDDGEVLQKAHLALGLGRLNPVAARNGSRPQVIWTIDSKLECLALTELLDLHHLRGQKLEQYRIWREAVRIWAARRYGLPRASRARLERLAQALKSARVYRPPMSNAPLPPMSDFGARHFFAGFFSGEGCFQLGERNVRFVIKLRRDDRPLLHAFRTEFGIGNIRDVETPEPWSPAAVWHVTSARDVLAGIELFDEVGLLGRKRRQFEAWRPGAEAVALAKIARGPVDDVLVTTARRNLARATAYTPPPVPLAADARHAEARIAYIDVLRSWAAVETGALSCTAYQAARRRHRHWPKRDTIAFAFGGWYEALRSAGLDDRAARRPSAV